ncbi:hypothetical protein Acr_11g0009280 [Actinidia rufa]|uniref:Uncharacterized protein n=1 Tax=Actinidia rufa TaxID=165716 RepID=A0A7J0FD58_9ERIC|nr:hypothetical protein Acr_11g0009280 [Actinidia rufa]
MANISQAPNLENIHREMHGIAEQIKIMNEINARLVSQCRHSIGQGHSVKSRPYQSTSLHSRSRSGPIMLESRPSSQTQDMMGKETRRCGRSHHRDDRAHSRHDKSTTQVPIEIKNEDFVKWSGKIKNNLL